MSYIPNIEFDKDFLEGITKIEQHKAPIKSDESVSIMIFSPFNPMYTNGFFPLF